MTEETVLNFLQWVTVVVLFSSIGAVILSRTETDPNKKQEALLEFKAGLFGILTVIFANLAIWFRKSNNELYSLALGTTLVAAVIGLWFAYPWLLGVFKRVFKK